jgi:hypothetical protein
VGRFVSPVSEDSLKVTFTHASAFDHLIKKAGMLFGNVTDPSAPGLQLPFGHPRIGDVVNILPGKAHLICLRRQKVCVWVTTWEKENDPEKDKKKR